MMHKEEEKSRMVCPFRVHGVTTPSATIPDAIFRNEYFTMQLGKNGGRVIIAFCRMSPVGGHCLRHKKR